MGGDWMLGALNEWKKTIWRKDKKAHSILHPLALLVSSERRNFYH